MTTYFVYIHNPKYPDKIQEFLNEVKAVKFSDTSWIFDSDKGLIDLFRQIGINVRKKGFVYIFDVSRPEEFLCYPKSAQDKFLRRCGDLDAILAQYQAEFEDDD